MKNIYINKSFLASGFALFFTKEAAEEDESSDSPYVDSKEYEISDEDYCALMNNFRDREFIVGTLEKYNEIRL